jgi:hypothetical protein
MSAFFIKHPLSCEHVPLSLYLRPIAYNLTTFMLQLSRSLPWRELWLLRRHNHSRQNTVPVKFSITDDVEKRI